MGIHWPAIPSRRYEISITTETTTKPDRVAAGPWSPLAVPTFRVLWIASLASNTGTWVHEVGAAWLMTSLDGTPQMVSAVRVAMSLPILLLAIPAGTLADRVDRPRLLVGVQAMLLMTAATLAVMTFCDTITPTWLLVLTGLMGLGLVIHVPTWQAMIPELIPREQIPQAVALGSISFNLARSVGPATGGLLISLVGTWASFAVNATSFAVVIATLVWTRKPPATTGPHEPFFASMQTGVRLVITDTAIRNVLLRLFLFVMPASAIWSLLPLIAKQQLRWDSRGYGALVAAIGVGAVVAAAALPRLRRLIGADQTVFVSMCVYAAALAVASISASPVAVMTAMLVIGLSWMWVLTTLNSTAQMRLTNSVRARGMACYLSVMAGGMATGSWTWGLIAEEYSHRIALLAAAAVMPIAAVLGTMMKLESRDKASLQ